MNRLIRLMTVAAFALALIFASSAATFAASHDGPRHPRPGHPPVPACDNPIGSISGVVSDADGNAVEGATVHVKGRVRGGTAQTAADGTYTVDSLCAGAYQVSAGLADVGRGSYDSDGDGQPDRVVIADDTPDAAGVDIVLGATAGPRPKPRFCTDGPGSIAGLIVDADGAPVEGAMVHVEGRHSKGRAETDSTGAYLVEGLCPGQFKVSAGARGVGRGVYDADGNGRPDLVQLTDDAPDASNIDIALGQGRHRP